MEAPFLAEERSYIGLALAQRLREGSMPPDDAYWWARILCEMTRRAQAAEPDSIFINTPVIKFFP